jgi:hypothetical protein
MAFQIKSFKPKLLAGHLRLKATNFGEFWSGKLSVSLQCGKSCAKTGNECGFWIMIINVFETDCASL